MGQGTRTLTSDDSHHAPGCVNAMKKDILVELEDCEHMNIDGDVMCHEHSHDVDSSTSYRDDVMLIGDERVVRRRNAKDEWDTVWQVTTLILAAVLMMMACIAIMVWRIDRQIETQELTPDTLQSGLTRTWSRNQAEMDILTKMAR